MNKACVVCPLSSLCVGKDHTERGWILVFYSESVFADIPLCCPALKTFSAMKTMWGTFETSRFTVESVL